MIIKGIVIEGEKKGRKFGFPTLNILNSESVLPGIYAGRVILEGKSHDAVIYIGEKRKEILEAHIFDFDEEIYGKEVEVIVMDKIREDREVEDMSKLSDMIKKDCEDAKIILGNKKK